jgi:hypothetical protein
MSRGAQQTTPNLTDQQVAQQNQMISQEGQCDAQDRSLLMPTIQSLLTTLRNSSRQSLSRASAHRIPLLTRSGKGRKPGRRCSMRDITAR